MEGTIKISGTLTILIIQGAWHVDTTFFQQDVYAHITTNVIFNTLRTGDADLRLYITTVQDGRRKSAFLTNAWFPARSRVLDIITQYMAPVSEWPCWRMFIET
jgi:hypothetical protein